MKKKISKSTVLLINVVVSLVGMLLISFGLTIEENARFKSLLEAVGIGLIATGGVNLLDKQLSEDVIEEKENEGFIRIVSNERLVGMSDVHPKKYTASKVDIVGINLERCLEEISGDPQQKMVRHIFSGNLDRIRLLLLHPNASFIKQRALEDNLSEFELHRRQKESVKLCINFYLLLKSYQNSSAFKDRNTNQKSATIEIRLIDFSPHITMERYDEELYWGLYTSDAIGLKSPIFKATQSGNPVLFEQLKKHFIGLRTKSINSIDNILVRMVMNDLHLNTELVYSIFSKPEEREVIKKLLSASTDKKEGEPKLLTSILENQS